MTDLAARPVRLAVRAATGDVPAGGLVHVAVSGGADSLSLLCATVAVARAGGWRVGVLTVDHGVQRETSAVSAAAARFAVRLGCSPVRVLRVRVGDSGGPEAAARTARLAALEQGVERDGACAVLLGHTLDDQAEQVLLGLARGSGARSLHGMPAERGPFRRPLLGVSRAEVRAGLPAPTDLQEPLLPWTDPTNSDEALLRARVRTKLLPLLAEVLGPGSVLGLARTADLLRADGAALDEWAERVVGDLVPDGPADVPVGPLAALPLAVRTRVLRLLARRRGAAALTSRHLGDLDALLVRWHGQGPVALPGRVTVQRMKGSDGCGTLRFGSLDGPPA